MGALRLSSIIIGWSSNSDRTKFLESQVATFGPAMRAGASKAAWTAIHTVLAFGGRKINRNPICTQCLKPDGASASTPQEIVDAMMQHFARIEGAKIMDPSMVAAQHSSLKPPSYDLDTRSITNVMPRRMLQASFASASQRAPGLDGLSNTLYKGASKALSEFLYPLIFKVQMHGEEPLSFKGGLAVDIVFKKPTSRPRPLRSVVYYLKMILPSTITHRCVPGW